eukprot:scaffold18471_cov103-Cylindrotheca_fusiformis.AAC.1
MIFSILLARIEKNLLQLLDLSTFKGFLHFRLARPQSPRVGPNLCNLELGEEEPGNRRRMRNRRLLARSTWRRTRSRQEQHRIVLLARQQVDTSLVQSYHPSYWKVLIASSVKNRGGTI